MDKATMDKANMDELNPELDEDVRFIYETRRHPDVAALLFGPPPRNMEEHRSWLKKNVPETRKIYILRDAGCPVGYCQVVPFGNLVEVGFVVHPDFQRRGYGDRMVKLVLELLEQTMPERRIILEVRPENDTAVRLYERNGFVRVAMCDDRMRMERTAREHVENTGVSTSKAGIGRVVFALNGHEPVLRRWAVEYLSEAMRSLGMDVGVVDFAKGGQEEDCDGARVVIVYRCFEHRVTRIMRRVKARGAFTVFFLDDYLFQPNCRYVGGWKFPLDPMIDADALMSSSAMLLSKMPFDKPKILRRSVLDKEAMDLLRQEYRREGVFTAGWIAGPGRGSAMDDFVSDVLSCLDGRMENNEVLRFYYFGRRQFLSYGRIEAKPNVYFEGWDWQGLYRGLASTNLGVVVNPMDENDEFLLCKSELKFVESAAMGVPLITSRVPPYTEFLKEGENGFFASTPEEFAEKILLVMRNEELSRKVSANALAYVREHYDVTKNAVQFLDDLAEAVGKVHTK